LTERGCGKGRASGSGTHSGIGPGESPGKWSGRTGVPGPWGGTLHFGGDFRRPHVTGFLGKGRSFPRTTIRKPGGERHRSVTRKTSGAGWSNQPQAESRPLVQGLGTKGWTQSVREPAVATVSQCGDPSIRRFWTNKIGRQNDPVSQPGSKNGRDHRGVRAPEGRRRKPGDDHGSAIRSEKREVSKRRSSA